MPTIPMYTLAWSSTSESYELFPMRSQERLPIIPDSSEWFTWLEKVPGFVFVGQNGSCTVLQEASGQGERSWYAYVAYDGELCKMSLGKRKDVTQARLESVAARLCAPHETEYPRQALTPPAPQELHSGTILSHTAESGQHLLMTKFNAPRLRTRMVSRTHLIEQVKQGVRGAFTLVSAPAGFGKTTLLAQWLVESGMLVAWLSLEPEDNDPTRFLTYLIVALQALGLQIGTSALIALRTLHPPSPKVVLTQLINELIEQNSGEIALVLDDYHVITTDAIQCGMAYFVEHMPSHLHLLIATRIDPPFPLARLRVRTQLTEVRATSLRFSTTETSTFLQHVMGLTLSAEEAATLEQRTEGWIAGLQLAALSLQTRGDATTFLAAFNGSHRFVLEYLSDEVLARQPAAVQTFLLHTCLLDRLSGPLCDAIMDQEGSQPMLEALERMNLFVVALDENQHWYRYHHLFAEVLRCHLQLREPALVPFLLRRASIWFEQHDLQFEAVRHALAIPDAELAARLIEPIAISVAFEGQVSTVLGWLDALPEALIRTRPLLCVYHAIVLTFTNQLEAAAARVQIAEWRMQGDVSTEQARTIQGLVFATRAALAYFSGIFSDALCFAHQALMLLPKAEDLSRAALMVIITSTYLVSGDVTLSTEYEVVEAGTFARMIGNLLSTVTLTCLLARLHILQGKLKLAATTYAQVAREVPLPEVLCTLFSCFFYDFGRGDLLREWNKLDEAREHLTQGIARINETLPIEPEVAILGYTALARLQQAYGNPTAAYAVLDAFVFLAEQRHFQPQMMTQVNSLRAQFALRQGNMTAAIHWADTSGLSLQDANLSYSHESEYLTLARVRIAQGRDAKEGPLLQEVLHLLDCLQASAEENARLSSVLEILIVRALALAAQGHSTTALAALEQALVQAEPEGYIRLFIDEGVPLLALLRSAQKHSTVPQYVTVLLAACGEPISKDRALLAPGSDRLLEPLTEREREVLHLLQEGASNREIAQSLVLSVNTVKRHVYNLCSKLGVQSRAQAMIRARDLHLGQRPHSTTDQF